MPIRNGTVCVHVVGNGMLQPFEYEVQHQAGQYVSNADVFPGPYLARRSVRDRVKLLSRIRIMNIISKSQPS